MLTESSRIVEAATTVVALSVCNRSSHIIHKVEVELT